MKKTYLLAALCCLEFSGSLTAQTVYKIDKSSPLAMKLSGTSTFHDWEMKTNFYNGDADFGIKEGDPTVLTSLAALNFKLSVQNLKSDEKKLDNNAYHALKAETYPDIDYKLSSAVISPLKTKGYNVKTQGMLTISGVTQSISMDVYCNVNSDGSVYCSGSKKLKMTDFNLVPPSFMGFMKTGNDITLDYHMVYRK